MSTSLHNWYSNLVQFYRRRFSPTRRQRQERWTAVEGLENRALLSAANSLMIPPDQQLVSVEHHADANNIQDVTEGHAHKHGNSHDLKFGSLKQQVEAKVKKGDYSGDWNLGIAGEAPSEFLILHVTQKGKKITATITQDGLGTVGFLDGRVRKGEFVADLTAPQLNSAGSLVLHRVSATELVGTITLTVSGQGTNVGTVAAEFNP